MKHPFTVYACASLLAAAGCGGNSDAAADPNGNWQVTLRFTTGNCVGLPPTYVINFDITQNPDLSYTFTTNTGTTGDSISGTMDCTIGNHSCGLDFADTGPGAEEQGIDSQTLSAVLVLSNNGLVGGSGMVMFNLTGGGTCTQLFTADGDVQ